MAFKKSTRKSKIVIDIDGPDGNAMVLLGMSQHWCKQLGLDWETIRKEATASDYVNVLKTLDKYFGTFVVFETNQKSLLKALKNA